MITQGGRSRGRFAFCRAAIGWTNPGKVVQPHVPHFMKQIDTGGRRANRLDLAKWLVSRDHPLTARVVVNRLWKSITASGFRKC